MAGKGLDLYWSGYANGLKGGTVIRKPYSYVAAGQTYLITAIKGRSADDDIWYEHPDVNAVKLDMSKEYVLGLDMSTSQSGLAIFSAPDMELLYMIDIVNSALRAEELYTHLRAFFDCNFRGLKFTLAIIEEQLKRDGMKVVYGKLSELQGVILSYSGILNKRIDRIAAGVWRKNYLASADHKGKKKNKGDLKIAAAIETQKRYPEFVNYISMMQKYSKADQEYICDSCDAVGVACGYVEENYGNRKIEGIRIISNTMEKESSHNSHQRPLRYSPDKQTVMDFAYDGSGNKEFFARTIEDLYEGIISGRGVEYYRYNHSMSLEENVCRVTSTTNAVSILLVDNPKATAQLQWEISEQLSPGEVMIVVCYRISASDKLRETNYIL